jgi:serine/threonine protein kinase
MIEQEIQQFGNYRLVRPLGVGGFARVYLGEHVYLKTYAAIKVLQARLASNKHEAFLTEARSIAHLKHINIVRVLEFGVEGNVPFLVMDYASNGSLRQRYPEGTRVALADILPYIQQTSAALQYAHHQHLVHCDVKPENMLLSARNELVLSDFGIAQVVHSTRQLDDSHEVVGTVMYMAPEQLQNQPCPASDQYALGTVVYEWLSGDYPFHGSFTEIASQHLLVPPPPLHEKGLQIAPAIEEVVMKALAKEPEQRFANVQDFASELEHAYHTEARTSVLYLSSTYSPSVPSPGTRVDSEILPPSEQHKPAYSRLSTGKIIALITLALLIVGSSIGLTYYAAIFRPAQAQVWAAATAQALAQANTARQKALYTQATNGKPVLYNPLNINDSNRWGEYDAIGWGGCTFTGGAYRVSVSSNAGTVTCWDYGGSVQYSNFACQVEMTITRGDMGGIIFRAGYSGAYDFVIGPNGSYTFTVTDAAGKSITLRNSFSPAIKTGFNQPNLITIIARGNAIDLYVNKQYIDHINDNTSGSGGLALIALSNTYPTDVAFRNIQIWQL